MLLSGAPHAHFLPTAVEQLSSHTELRPLQSRLLGHEENALFLYTAWPNHDVSLYGLNQHTAEAKSPHLCHLIVIQHHITKLSGFVSAVLSKGHVCADIFLSLLLCLVDLSVLTGEHFVFVQTSES